MSVARAPAHGLTILAMASNGGRTGATVGFVRHTLKVVNYLVHLLFAIRLVSLTPHSNVFANPFQVISIVLIDMT